jgi:dynein heavy chain
VGSKDRVHVLEGAVITWTKQIRHVLKQDPEMLLKDGRSNPEPSAELQFWKNKAANLNSIHSQLGMDGLKKVLKFLETNKSTYTTPFSRLQKEVEEAREEANDNLKFLSTLNKGIEKLMNEGADFEALDSLFDGVLHTILLIWRYSKYYNTPTRLAVLIREICNTLIKQATRYISGPDVFAMISSEEASECYDKLDRTLQVCTALKHTYDVYSDIADQQGGDGWKMKHDALFVRLDAFRERCRDALDFTRTVMQFTKLERIEIGGTKGKTLSDCVVAIHEEFNQAVDAFKNVNYDIMDVGERQFDHDFYNFRVAVKELDRRLGSLLGSAFDDLDTVQGRLKLFDNFEGLLERPIIQAELERKHKMLLKHYQQDLAEVETNFIENREKVDECFDDAPIYSNLPPVAGAIYWARSALTRIEEPMSKLIIYNQTLRETPEEFREVDKQYDNLKAMLQNYEKKRYEGWEETSVDVAKEKLKMRLLRRQEKSGLLKVNFDPALVRLLREVRFFLIFDIKVPEAASEMFGKAGVYRQWVGQLDHIVQMYNSVLTELLPVEEPLLEDRITKMDSTLSPGLTDLKWRSEDKIPEFIEGAMKVVSDVSSVVDIIKQNLRNISKILSTWCKEPIIERKRGAKPMSMEAFDLQHKERVGVRMMAMSDGGKEIHKFLKDSSEALKVSKVATTWKAYVDFVNNIVIEGFVASIAVSLQNLCEILDPLFIERRGELPLFDIKIELQEQIVFEPSFRPKGSEPSLRKTIDDWLKDFFGTVTCMARLDVSAGDYLNEIREHFQMQSLLSLVSDNIDNTEEKCMEYRDTFMQHSFLWMDSIDKSFEKFLSEGAHDLVEGFEEEGMNFRQVMDRIKVDIGRPIPKLAEFDKKIEFFAKMKQDLSNIKTPEDIHWLRINVQPVKIALVKFAKEWEDKYTNFIKDFTESRIKQLVDFIDKLKTGLGSNSPVDDPENEKLLYATMNHIADVKLAKTAVNELFQPIRELCSLLKKHHVTHEGLQDLEQAPSKWSEVIRLAWQEKEKILPLQNEESIKIRNKIDAFGDEVQAFRKKFQNECPFDETNAVNKDYEKSYDVINEYYTLTLEISDKAKEYNDLELLFDMQMSNYRDLKECVVELVLLKNLWDGVILVLDTFVSWNDILWEKIDTDALVQTVRDFQTQVKNMPKGMRVWKLYKWLMDEVKNMATVLPLINDLHSETMQDRHWTSLMTVTQTTFDKGPDFCFKNLLDLHLHHFADEVSEIVDQSVKEAKIEKKLHRISKDWAKMPVTFDVSNPECPLLGELGEVLERLDGDSLEMMGMTSQGRFIEFCKPMVDEWSGKLRTIDSTLNVWQKVQSNWCRLEPIFMQSDDIRSQLPEDAKRFETMDNQWKDLMLDASQSYLIVDICCAEGREEALVTISEGIDTCEKSLNEYLEQKKKVFPRFYFVANQALLDILSNGNRPLKIAEYLGDMFDGVQTLNFEKAQDTGKIASGIVAKDGEKVHFAQDITLEGAVENYLVALEAHFRLMLRESLEQARHSADNWETENAKTREYWLEDYCAQLALVGTQIIWTEESMRTFEEIESGSENAMKEYKKVNDERIEKLIKRVQTPLSREVRNKIITIITIDVHARDVIENFVVSKITDSSDFKWLQQLRFHWGYCPQGMGLVSYTPDEQKTCVIKICDWVTIYCYEYVGNCGRLVITPLTDRCYITLTQALNLTLGGAPAGPAGTGKTETTKDLSRAIGLQIVVFNCSDQMTYHSMAQIFMGIAQTGCWGCFDEFNRISIEVLSVVSTQYKTILDGIRAGNPMLNFMDEEIRLITTNGAFITMNPGYAGRTELPENLKALFRSVAMIVPDLRFICENMLMSEGFIKARPLANKFVQLYALCKELLSKQMHYDWGLRAVKSLLRQAGGLKRAEPESDENPVLCRALRDFNTPKITTGDMPIFLRLIQDLFPGIWPNPFENPEMEKVVIEVSKQRGLQPDAQFVIKTVGMLGILEVRHCMFIIGPTGCGKTEVWKTLMESLKASGKDGMWEQANPKGVTSDELYGTMSKTKEWKDGLIAVIMRNMSKEMNGYKPSHVNKWVILDGDIDATWIESMNTVMDDNKVLTLVSNERIPFSPTMRMILEIQDMKHASPATVSRGGVLFINETDIGWKPYMESWREKMDPVPQNTFYLLFANYFESQIDGIRKQFNFTCPIYDMGFVQAITCFVDALLENNTKENLEAMRTMSTEDLKNTYDAIFAYAMMWSIGGAVADDKVTNYRKYFNSYMKGLSKVKFPDTGDCYDFYYDLKTKEWASWEDCVVPYNPIADRMYQNIVISNFEIERNKYILDLHIKRKKPVLFVGVAGTGKTTIVKDYLADLKAKDDNFTSQSINNNNYTTSARLQGILMGSLDKRSGRTYGPPGNKKCVYFIDDLNMPFVDTYDTQSAIMLLTQMLAYAEVYDREHLEEKKNLVDILFTCCMNPKAGSFMVNPRLQRRFTVLTAFSPTAQLITSIYSAILSKHLEAFVPAVQKLCEPIVQGTIESLQAILSTPCFLPSASKFHYQFNLKDVSNIFQGLLNTNPALYKDGAPKFARAWLHECFRTFSDRLVNKDDQVEMNAILEKVSGKAFQGMSKDELFAQPLIFTSFVSQAGGNERQYLPVKDGASLKKVLDDKMVEYNETYAAMNLVLFDDALAHICRISRITDNPCGNALLVGVGGSGKQSLARLGSFINNQEVLSILVNQSYGLNELKVDLQEFYKKAAVKPGLPHAFLMTDGQIADERFLVDINDMLSSGNIPDLFTREEYDGIFGGVRNAAKAAGYGDDREGLFAFFIDKVRKNLHLILCHSPVGDDFRIRGRKFPALISCTVVDEFMPWPRDALDGVARKFLVTLQEAGNIADETMLGQVAANMAEVHLSIDVANKNFLVTERRYNYTTPKSFLELIQFYIKMLTEKQSAVTFNSERLERGLAIMEQVQAKVEGLKEDLKITMVQVEEKKAATAILIEQVTKASAHAAEEKAKANEEEEKTTVLANDAAKLQAEADGELKEAMPAMAAAAEAVNCLDKNSIGELKGFGKPPPECVTVCAACAFLLKNEKKAIDWKAAQKMMNNPAAFIDEVKSFNANEIPENSLKLTDECIALPFFNYETMKGKSSAAANLANWVINCVKYHKIYVKVAPLMAKVAEATQTKETAEASLAIVKKQVADIEAECAALDEKLNGAVNEKERVEQQAAQCLQKLQLAERLVNGLADEYKRWTESVKEMKELTVKLIGNCLLSSAFVGYISPFNARLRLELWKETWIKDITDKNIPISDKIDPLKVLASEADMAGWQNEGLPSDRISLENASVVTSCSRWPLMIDPQLQGVKWIKQRIGEDLQVLQFTMNNWLQKVIFSIQMGGQLLLESVGSEIDAILEPVLSRAVVKRGRTAMIIKIGGEEVDYDPKFQLYLQSKLPNPHYRPEIAAQCTIINFIVTPEGLEDQILAMVVNVEKPELEQQKQALVRRQNEFKVTLASLEDDLLSQLSAADPATILDNLPLIEGLEKTKQTSKEIGIQVLEAQKTEVEINDSREKYRPVAAEGSMLFFLIIQLCFIEHMYQYSLDSFVTFLYKAIDKTEPSEDIVVRSQKLIEMIRMVIFRWVNRGLFEEHKLIFCSMLTFKLFQKGQLQGEEFNPSYFNFLLRAPMMVGAENPLAEWLPNKNWSLALKLTELDGFDSFATNMEKDAPNRFKEWFNELAPESTKLPLDWKRLDSLPFQKLLVLRCLRPDRITGAMADWIRSTLPNGRDYMDCDGSSSFQQILVSSFEDSTATTPIFFILSPGADPVKEVEAMGRKLINLQLGVNYHNVAMGQGQDVVAMAKLEIGHREGHWVMLQNIHLMPKWCVELEKKLDAFAVENSHPSMRVILSADPNKGIPIGILERSIKLTNEPPQGMLANLRRSFALFSKEDFEDKDARVKSILFALVHFHSLMLERKKFGPMGYNMKYPFNAGDLRDSAQVLYNYLEGTSSVKIPWDDLRYIFGEIMYGGHIVDDWDRRMCEKYLSYFMRDELLDEIEMIPYAEGKLSWISPQAGPHEKYIEHIETMPTESPLFFGMHPNAEINFRTTQCDKTFELLMMLSGSSSGGDDGDAAASPMAIAEALCTEILEEVQEKKFATDDINKSLSDEEKGPYQFVFLQECDYMNGLIYEMVRGLQELQLGFKGELTMSAQMEDIADSLFLEKLPTWWVKLGFPSTRPLKSWRVNLQERCVQLEDWTNDPLTIPKVVDIAKLFNPQSFLTAIKQLCCQQQGLELDKLQVFTDVTKRDVKQVEGHSKEGAFVTGMYLEGARWDSTGNSLEDSKPKEMFTQLPVINCKAGPVVDKIDKNIYICPAYCVPIRRPYFVFPAQLRTKAPADKWVLAGVAIILDIGI